MNRMNWMHTPQESSFTLTGIPMNWERVGEALAVTLLFGSFYFWLWIGWAIGPV